MEQQERCANSFPSGAFPIFSRKGQKIMCAIAGFIDYREDARRFQGAYQEMLLRMGKRGPDERGQYLTENACLLHARLAVIDPENGKQPMCIQAGEREIVLVYNGELYNTADLRQELCRVGHVFKEHSDTEVLLHAYLEWGEQCVEKLNGIYAFAIWDAHSKKLFAARDRMGVKPFFYALIGGNFLFASEIKALLCHPLVQPEVDRQGLAELLLIGPGRTPGCGVFRHIRELKPGCSAVFSPEAGLCVHAYWALHAKPHVQSFPETVETVRELVSDAIRRQTVSDVPLCAFLSGGLDSSIISSLSGVEQTFSVSYRENEKYFQKSVFQPNSDDLYIRKMAEFLGIHHTNIELDTDALVDALFEAVQARDLPGMADVDSSLLLFCRQVKPHATVALSGECADELFGGYPWYRNAQLLEFDGFPWSQSTAYRAAFANPEIWQGLDPEEYVREKYLQTFAGMEYANADDKKEKRMRQMFKLNTEWFMQTLLDRKDRMSMYSSLEVRVPFCDHRLTEYLYNVPWVFKNHQGREKGLLRQAMEGVLPEEVLWRKKSPYPKTHHPDYLEKVSALLQQLLCEPNAPLFDIVNRKALEQLLQAKNETPWYGQLMTVPQTIAYFLQMHAWMKKYHVRILA